MAAMFKDISKRYDFLNHVFSLGGDLRWRKASVKYLNYSKDAQILDFGAGTGDFSFALRQHSSAHVTALDLVPEMLDQMKMKAGANSEKWLKLVQGDGEALPFKENTFDGAVAGFVGRNLLDLPKGLSELYRVIKPSKKLGFLEFCKPESGFTQKATWLYHRLIIAPVGNLLIRGNKSAYQYLIDSIESFYTAAEMRNLMKQAGFRNVISIRFNFGTVILTVATK
ncbi:MAG: ubiquinone/menaquinone biosynthesis methyltransferase [Candidatus Marinimicrobia bacterium]|jgi:demethylmenaquinone methyltransferase/2-methoxy-6-polyprenyl-1,4-benzoquinol methylase|nr:ubiquinone/menaquinone biosynthesis methyltransferase [Candidatus Neomarinimicrobiota bacterium]MBT4569892.1 ubiquinone/menaquinone biosynthesis methyltransferase [Candidatus Neomarinimicrobiota bacterium]